MFKVVPKKIVILLTFIALATECFSQNPFNPLLELRRNGYREKLFLVTDRDVYFAGEEIWLKIVSQDALTGQPQKMSKIVYLDLLDRDNNPVIQIKQELADNSDGGSIVLPDSLATGIYILRAYTSWMLNFNENEIWHKTITIISPAQRITTGILPKTILLTSPPEKDESAITILIPDEVKGRRNEKSIVVLFTDNTEKTQDYRLSVAVVKSSLLASERKNYMDHTVSSSDDQKDVKFIFRLPEPEGLILRGTMVDNTTARPLVNEEVSLSIVGKTTRCRFTNTNENGEFVFLLNDFYGQGEVVIQPVSETLSDIYVELESPFYDHFYEIDPEIFIPDTASLKGISDALVSSQINRLYRSEFLPAIALTKGKHETDLYGEPTRRVMLADYIELTDLREIVREILSEVMIIRKDEKTQLKVTSKNPYETFDNQALVLVDGVPCSDIGKLLSAGAKEFERIDIVKKKYFRHGLIFDGIVSFVTKKGNLSLFEADNTVFRQVFEGPQPVSKFYSPDYSVDSLRTRRVPDERNTLYWNPDIRPDSVGKIELRFFSSDEDTDYTLIIEGISGDGRHIYKTQELSEKNN